MDPATLAIVGTAISAVSAIGSAVGSIQQSNAQSNAAQYNADVAERNATIAQQQAKADADAQRRHALVKIGAARAMYGASGVALEGSPLDVLQNSAINAELDNQTILYKGKLRALGYTDSATLDRAGSGTDYLGATGYLLSGLGDAAYQGQGLLSGSSPTTPQTSIGAQTQRVG